MRFNIRLFILFILILNAISLIALNSSLHQGGEFSGKEQFYKQIVWIFVFWIVIVIFYFINYIVLALFACVAIFPFIHVLATSFSSSRAIMSGEVSILPV
ncbi:MAG: hypothetical protein NC822_01640, partial [Candidatus Omnitrophica bacterium]|nr:hypothetical protein [Candidatus Omnitrophota bacterium]